MKRLLNRQRMIQSFLVLGLLLGAVSARADGDIEMVTYFPTPYVAYNNLFLVGDAEHPASLDVGLLKGKSFELNLGKDGDAEDSSSSLLAQEGAPVNLKKGKLGLDLNLYTPTAIFGDTTPDTKEDVTMSFQNLRIDTLANAIDEAPKSITAPKVTTSGKVSLFEKKPGQTTGYVQNAALPNCESIVSWKTLKINGKQGLYLTCGDAPTGTCPSGKYKLEKYSGTLSCYVPYEYKDRYCEQTQRAYESIGNDDDYPWTQLALVGGEDPIIKFSKCRYTSGSSYMEWDPKNDEHHRWFIPIHASSSLCEPHYIGAGAHYQGDEVCLDDYPGVPHEEELTMDTCDSVGDPNMLWYSDQSGKNPGFTLYFATCKDE